jgi:hypothetical protein
MGELTWAITTRLNLLNLVTAYIVQAFTVKGASVVQGISSGG